MSWIKPITDRTIEDVDFARRNPWSLDNLKGAFNSSDMNRISGNILYYIQYPLHWEEYLKTNWKGNDSTIPDIPRERDFIDLVTALTYLRGGYFNLTLPSVPELPYNTYEKINIIETILENISRYIQNSIMGRTTIAFELGGDDFE